MKTKLDKRKRLPVNRIKDIAFNVVNWALTREKLRETQLLVKKKLDPSVTVANPFEEDFVEYVEALIQQKVEDMEIIQKMLKEERLSKIAAKREGFTLYELPDKLLGNNTYTITEQYLESDDILFDVLFEDHTKLKDSHKLLSLLCGAIDGALAQDFWLGDEFFEALENEYEYSGFSFKREEIPILLDELVHEGYIDLT